MPAKTPLTIFWLRRDLRLDDNAALYHALKQGTPVMPLFIFDTEILDRLNDKEDKRVLFIHQEIQRLGEELKEHGSAVLVKHGKPVEVWKGLLEEYNIQSVYTNHDFEPYAIERDRMVCELLAENGAGFFTYKDHVIFEKEEVLKDDGKPYTVFTPYSRKWMERLRPFYYKPYPALKYAGNFIQTPAFSMPSLKSMGFKETAFVFPPRVVKAEVVNNYHKQRDYPAVNGTSHLGIHLRFGTLSIRRLLAYALKHNETFTKELIWREFYQQILWHFPHVVNGAFRPEYDRIKWQNDEKKFSAWCEGYTGYPLVDAGMRELNATGYMHNRARMVVASFLTKHLLIDWRWGEAYFAEKLLDFELASNNGGWQWASGSGTDAAPYFRVFNPTLQMQKFDPDGKYVRKWVPEYFTMPLQYPQPIVNHQAARMKVMEVYKAGLGK